MVFAEKILVLTQKKSVSQLKWNKKAGVLIVTEPLNNNKRPDKY